MSIVSYWFFATPFYSPLLCSSGWSLLLCC